MASTDVQFDDNSSWEFWDKVYSNRELRQKMEEKTHCEISMSELLKSSSLCRAELIVLNVPRMAPSHENTIRLFIKNHLKVDVPIINMDITPKKWILRFYRREDASRVLHVMAGQVFRCRVLHVNLHEVNTEVDSSLPSLNVEDILPHGLPVSDRNVNWGTAEWSDIQIFRSDLIALLRRNPSGMLMEDALCELKATYRYGVICHILKQYPLGLLRLYTPQIRMIGRYLSLSEQDNITALVRLTVSERTPRSILEEWEIMSPSEIRSEQQLMDYFARLLDHFGPQHITMSLPLRLAVSTISPFFPRRSTELAKRLVQLSPTFILFDDTLYLSMSIRHRRILMESISPSIANFSERK